MGFVGAADQSVFLQNTQHFTDIPQVVSQEFLGAVTCGPDDDIVDVWVRKLQVSQHPSHHSLELGTCVFEAHHLHLVYGRR